MAAAAGNAQGKVRRRFTDRQENLIFTFFFVLAAEAFLLLIVYYVNVDFLNIRLSTPVGDCCEAFNIWDILTPINIFGFITLAAIVAAIASNAMD